VVTMRLPFRIHPAGEQSSEPVGVFRNAGRVERSVDDPGR
jgi:hypothetical protein